jgi:hypothetical protein
MKRIRYDNNCRGGEEHDENLVYDSFFDSVHVDEKWFFLTEENM